MPSTIYVLMNRSNSKIRINFIVCCPRGRRILQCSKFLQCRPSLTTLVTFAMPMAPAIVPRQAYAISGITNVCLRYVHFAFVRFMNHHAVS